MSEQVYISGSVIIVEDNESLRSELEQTLSENGFDVRGVDSGEALNGALLQRPANVVVLDLNLAGEDGISIARRIRTAFPEIGILMLTARVMSAQKEEVQPSATFCAGSWRRRRNQTGCSTELR